MNKQTVPPTNVARDGAYYWLRAERASEPSVGQWMRGRWYLIGETNGVSPTELCRRGWGYFCECKPLHEYEERATDVSQ